MPTGVKYPEELRERAIRLVDEATAAEPGQTHTAICKRIGERLGVHPTTLRGWLRARDEKPGSISHVAKAEAQEIKKLKAEIRELKRANEILKLASAFFARELDPKLPE